MQLDRDTFIELRSVLANMYPTQEDSRRVVKDAKLDQTEIAFHNKPVLNWEAILTYSEMTEQTFDVVDVALRNAPKNSVLNEIKNYRHILPAPAPRFDKGLTWKGPEEDSGGELATLEKLIEAESTLLPISFLEVGLQRSKAVARVRLSDGELGTGFLTVGNIFVTNHHVLKNKEQAGDAVIQFNYQNTASGLDLEPTVFSLAPENGFATSEKEDWTLVPVKGDAGKDWGEIALTQIDNYEKIKYVNIIQHPGGEPKQIALYHNIVAYADDKVFQYLTDTRPGSSGSPVFDNKWRVVALHHSGGWLADPGTKKANFRNEGININLIVKALANFQAKA